MNSWSNPQRFMVDDSRHRAVCHRAVVERQSTKDIACPWILRLRHGSPGVASLDAVCADAAQPAPVSSVAACRPCDPRRRGLFGPRSASPETCEASLVRRLAGIHTYDPPCGVSPREAMRIMCRQPLMLVACSLRSRSPARDGSEICPCSPCSTCSLPHYIPFGHFVCAAPRVLRVAARAPLR